MAEEQVSLVFDFVLVHFTSHAALQLFPASISSNNPHAVAEFIDSQYPIAIIRIGNMLHLKVIPTD